MRKKSSVGRLCYPKSLSGVFYACTQKSLTSLLRICVYAQKIQQMVIIKSSNNPIVDVLRPAQKLQVWNMYIPDIPCISRVLSKDQAPSSLEACVKW